MLDQDDGVRVATRRLQARARIQADFARAVMWSKGFASDEASAAFDRVAAFSVHSEAEAFAVQHSRWTMALVRGELSRARALASAFLHEAETSGRVAEAGVALRGLGLMAYFSGEFVEARRFAERALATCGPEFIERPRTARGRTPARSPCVASPWRIGNWERSTARENS